MPDPTTPAAPAEGAAATSAPVAAAAPAAGAGAPNPGDTTQAKPGEASASASTGTDATKGTPAAPAEGDKKDAEPAKAADSTKDTAKDAEKDTAAEKDAPLELKLPDGFVKDEVVLGEFQGLAKELGLKGEHAQKLVDLHVKMQESFIAQVQQEQAAQAAEWRKQVESDTATYGKQPYEAIVATATRAMERYGTPELRQVLNDTGLGNHPALIKFVYGIGKSMREDSVAGTSGPGAGSRERTPEDVMRERYPSMFQPKT